MLNTFKTNTFLKKQLAGHLVLPLSFLSHLQRKSSQKVNAVPGFRIMANQVEDALVNPQNRAPELYFICEKPTKFQAHSLSLFHSWGSRRRKGPAYQWQRLDPKSPNVQQFYTPSPHLQERGEGRIISGPGQLHSGLRSSKSLLSTFCVHDTASGQALLPLPHQPSVIHGMAGLELSLAEG